MNNEHMARWQHIIKKYNLSDSFILNIEGLLGLYVNSTEGELDKILVILEACLGKTNANLHSNKKEDFIIFYREFMQTMIPSDQTSDKLQVINDASADGAVDETEAIEQVKMCVVITEFSPQHITFAYGDDFLFNEETYNGPRFQSMHNAVAFRFNLHNFDSSFRIGCDLEQKEDEKSGAFFIVNKNEKILTWPNTNSCLFCTFDKASFVKNLKDHGLDDDFYYKEFFLSLLKSRGLFLGSNTQTQYNDGVVKDSDLPVDDVLFNIGHYCSLSDFFAGNELLEIEGVGAKTKNKLVEHNYRIVDDVIFDTDKKLVEILGTKKAQTIKNNARNLRAIWNG